MHWRYCGLAIVLVAFCCARFLANTLLPGSNAQDRDGIDLSGDSDPESRLAQGMRVSLHCIDVATLEMLNGVSDKLAFGLVDKRGNLLTMRQHGISEMQALQTVHGVGAVKAKELTRYIRVDGSCNFPSDGFLAIQGTSGPSVP